MSSELVRSLTSRAKSITSPSVPEIETSYQLASRDLDKSLGKVLFLCHDFPNVHAAGAQLYARDLAMAINRTSHKWRVDVMYPKFRDYFTQYALKHKFEYNLNLYELVKDRSFFYNKRSITHEVVAELFDDFLTRNRYDVIHIQGLGELSAAPIEVAQQHGVPTIATLHDFWFMCDLWFLTNSSGNCSGPTTVDKCTDCLLHERTAESVPNMRPVVRDYVETRTVRLHEAFQKIDRLFAPSKYVADIYEKYGFRGVEARPLGLNAPTHRPAKRTKPGRITFGYIGNIAKHKGVPLALDAFQALQRKRGIRLELWGKSQSGALSRRIENVSSSDRRVRWHGPYEQDAVSEILSYVDILIVPSHAETFSIVVREAFQNQTPVIAANTGGIKEAFEDGRESMFFEVGNSEDLAFKMQQIIDNPDLVRQMRDRIPSVKTIDDDAEFYLSEYQDVLNSAALAH